MPQFHDTLYIPLRFGNGILITFTLALNEQNVVSFLLQSDGTVENAPARKWDTAACPLNPWAKRPGGRFPGRGEFLQRPLYNAKYTRSGTCSAIATYLQAIHFLLFSRSCFDKAAGKLEFFANNLQVDKNEQVHHRHNGIRSMKT